MKGILHRIDQDLKESVIGREKLPPIWLRALDLEIRLSLDLLLDKHARFELYYRERNK